MPNKEKREKVKVLTERIRVSGALLLAEYRGLSVHDATELRRSLSGHASFAIAKNTLLRRAADEAGVEGLDPLLTGPTAVAFVEGDVVTTAKRLVEAAKKHPAIVLKGGYMDGRVLDADEAKALADLESREVMLSKIAGMLKSEMSRAASMFQALQSRFVGLMEALRDKLPPEEVTEEPEPAAAAEEPEAEAEQPAAEPETETQAEEPAAEAEEPAAEAETETETEEPAAETAGATDGETSTEGEE
jgi:large subunit ribosomal protein L10